CGEGLKHYSADVLAISAYHSLHPVDWVALLLQLGQYAVPAFARAWHPRPYPRAAYVARTKLVSLVVCSYRACRTCLLGRDCAFGRTKRRRTRGRTLGKLVPYLDSCLGDFLSVPAGN